MNVWILQDQAGKSLRIKLSEYKKDEVWWWNVDRYCKEESPLKMRVDDPILLWQTEVGSMAPTGIYAVGKIVNGPYHQPNEKSNWRIDIRLDLILAKPVTKAQIMMMREPEFKQFPIIKMPGGHIVFPVTLVQWEKLQLHFPSLTTSNA